MSTVWKEWKAARDKRLRGSLSNERNISARVPAFGQGEISFLA